MCTYIHNVCTTLKVFAVSLHNTGTRYIVCTYAMHKQVLPIVNLLNCQTVEAITNIKNDTQTGGLVG